MERSENKMGQVYVVILKKQSKSLDVLWFSTYNLPHVY